MQESKQRGKIAKVFARSPSKRVLSSPLNGATTTESNGTSLNGKNQLLTITKSCRPHDNKVTSKESIPRKAWEQQSDEYVYFLGVYYETCLCKISIHFIDNFSYLSREEGFIERLARSYDSPAPPVYSSETHSPVPSDDNLVTIRLIADEQGRFGFNVKGGIDLNLPVQVSRVVPNTPADRSTPKICEGDHVIMINGRDVNGLRHEQVVSLIRTSRESRSGELVLVVKPNSSPTLPEEEPLYQYVPDENDDIVQQLLDGDALFTQSLLLLSDGLASGALLSQYEQLYRKNPDLTITEAKKPENVQKNRYRDISPCKCTFLFFIESGISKRVHLTFLTFFKKHENLISFKRSE